MISLRRCEIFIYDRILLRLSLYIYIYILNGAREYYAQWYKSNRERQILHDIIYMYHLKNNAV